MKPPLPPSEVRQRKMEEDAVHDGVKRYRRLLKHQPRASSPPGIEFLRRHFGALARLIGDEQERVADPREELEKYSIPLVSLDAEKLAFITLQSTFNLLADNEENGDEAGLRHTYLAMEIGRRAHDQRMVEVKKGEQRDLDSLVGSRYSAISRKREIRGQTRKLDEGDWSKDRRDLHLGAALIDLAAKIPDAFVVEKESEYVLGKRKTIRVVRLAHKSAEELRLRNEYFELLAPVHRAMIIPPRRWTPTGRGGYLRNGETQDIELVKHWNNPYIRKALSLAASEGRLNAVLSAVNSLQETPWRINARVYSVMRIFGSRNKTRASLDLQRKVRACRRLLNERHIFFPYQLDYRGRAYPVPQTVNPQSDDPGRALLEFADGKLIEKTGTDWLAVHVANTFGEDKKPFDERRRWVFQNEPMIMQTASAPLHSQFWLTAKKPWCFLAACLEWADCRKDGAKFKSHLPIAMDGTCNGLQHLSAMARDSYCAAATNLLPGNRPEDVYELVAERVAAVVNRDCERDIPEALDWRDAGGITRDLVKRPTMTTPYGITRDGIVGQLMEKCETQDRRKGRTAGRRLALRKPAEAARYLAPILQSCIGELLGSAKEVMEWLQRDIAAPLSRRDLGIHWHSPTGFPVVQEPRKLRKKQVIVRGYSLTVYDESSPQRINPHEQRNAIVPNLVHSMDAAHMALTVNALREKGLIHFAMIHDSYGVHACDVDVLHLVLREQFASIYEKPVLNQFYQEQKRRHPNLELTAPPKLGSFDMKVLKESDYFFC
jgi:DNA-directed RNA polymerase